MTDEELTLIVERALEKARPALVEAVSAAVKADLADTLELLGLSAPTPEDRQSIRKDMEFLRSLRGAANSLAGRVVNMILALVIVGFLALAGYGALIQAKGGK